MGERSEKSSKKGNFFSKCRNSFLYMVELWVIDPKNLLKKAIFLVNAETVSYTHGIVGERSEKPSKKGNFFSKCRNSFLYMVELWVSDPKNLLKKAIFLVNAETVSYTWWNYG